MKYLKILFWLFVAAALAWSGAVVVGLVVTGSYQPNITRGDLLHPWRYVATGAVFVAAIVVFGLWLTRRPLSNRTYGVFFAIIAVASLITVLPRIDSGYR